MGSFVPRPRRPVSTTTSVRVEVALFIEARKRGMNLSSVLNASLKALLGEQKELADEEVARIFREQSERVGDVVKKEAEETISEIELGYRELQPAWNVYLSEDPSRTHNQKIAWIGGRKLLIPALKVLSDGDILRELEGTPP